MHFHLDKIMRPLSKKTNKKTNKHGKQTKKTLQKADFKETKPLKPTWKKKDLKAPVKSLLTNLRLNKIQSLTCYPIKKN